MLPSVSEYLLIVPDSFVGVVIIIHQVLLCVCVCCVHNQVKIKVKEYKVLSWGSFSMCEGSFT